MAEWAYDASRLQSDLPCEPQKIKDYAERADKTGSLLGETMHGVQVKKGYLQPIDVTKGEKMIMDAADAGHPYAKCLLARDIITKIQGSRLVKGVPEDPELALKLHAPLSRNALSANPFRSPGRVLPE